MKKIFILLIALNFALSGFCQQVVINDSVSFIFPNGSEKLTANQAQSYVKQKFSNNKWANIVRPDEQYIYKINDVLIMFLFRNIGEDLKERKKGTDGHAARYRSSDRYTSILKTINNNQVLITSNIIDNIDVFQFYCCDESNKEELIGVLQFDVADKDKATIVLNNLLNSIKFQY